MGAARVPAETRDKGRGAATAVGRPGENIAPGRAMSVGEDVGPFVAASVAAWGGAVVQAVGGIAPDTYEKAEAANEMDEASVNHPAGGAPVIEATRHAGGGAMLAGVGGGSWTSG